MVNINKNLIKQTEGKKKHFPVIAIVQEAELVFAAY